MTDDKMYQKKSFRLAEDDMDNIRFIQERLAGKVSESAVVRMVLARYRRMIERGEARL